ncbi:hypothetical protein ACG02S_25900 [Roseateles sp. DC23W]|uniref:Uncharacterized protein n=1 Tax=Pelomonas dachongensis TaxID=3299029 RepID=A0ABW7EV00_9BURK
MTSTFKLPNDFFTNDLGIKIRAIGPEAIVVACYLAANQNANAFGLYRTSPALVSIETGLSFCSVHESFERLTGAGFLVFDDVYNLVWVREMAA